MLDYVANLKNFLKFRNSRVKMPASERMKNMPSWQ